MEIITLLLKATAVLLNNIILKEVIAVKAVAGIAHMDIIRKLILKNNIE
ncbi:hypothetical protein SAMN04488552_0912 [Christiangramia echinicola]|uniref:Uncharacterized protein n=1 Tax=Christiangramia echinicola TaxID=279359 RepID=A0A1H1LNS0_9FLAO|nr:hypothetical protein SAMN04488552_0912 [Christiangramia echinicola]